MSDTVYQESLVELLAILDNSPIQEVNKIPMKLMEFFRRNASKTYTFNFDKTKKIKDLKLKKETKGLLAMIYRNYLCTDEERLNYEKLLRDNQKKYEDMMQEKYGYEHMFNNSNSQEVAVEQEAVETQSLVPYKENIFTKIINKIKSFFKFKK